MDHAEGDRRINKGKEVVVEKEWQQFQNRSNSSSKRSTVDTMSVLITNTFLRIQSQYPNVYKQRTILLRYRDQGWYN